MRAFFEKNYFKFENTYLFTVDCDYLFHDKIFFNLRSCLHEIMYLQ